MLKKNRWLPPPSAFPPRPSQPPLVWEACRTASRPYIRPSQPSARASGRCRVSPKFRTTPLAPLEGKAQGGASARARRRPPRPERNGLERSLEKEFRQLFNGKPLAPCAVNLSRVYGSSLCFQRSPICCGQSAHTHTPGLWTSHLGRSGASACGVFHKHVRPPEGH